MEYLLIKITMRFFHKIQNHYFNFNFSNNNSEKITKMMLKIKIKNNLQIFI